MSPKDFLRKFKVDVEKFLRRFPSPGETLYCYTTHEESQNPVEARG